MRAPAAARILAGTGFPRRPIAYPCGAERSGETFQTANAVLGALHTKRADLCASDDKSAVKRGKLRRLGGMGAFQGRRDTAVDSSETLTRRRRLPSD